MRKLPAAARSRLSHDVRAARDAERVGDIPRGWALLEEAHVLSQPSAAAHVRVHLAMLGAGLRQRDGREVRGQVLRLLVAGPGSLTGRYPRGNTGRARVPARQPMPLPDELHALLDGDATS